MAPTAHPVRRLITMLAGATVGASALALVALGPAGAATSGVATFDAVINGQPSALSTDAHPVQIYPSRPTAVRLTVRNTGTTTLHVATVRIEGDVIALPLFSFDTAVGLVVKPGASMTIRYGVSMTGVGSQATGLVGSTISLLAPGGGQIASQALVTEVHGSLRSIYGLFGLAVLLLTVSSFVLALLAMARHTLPANRWLRGVRFFIPGFGLGLVLTFSFSALEIFTPGPSHWLPLLVGTSIVGFAAGYLTPAPNDEVYDDYDDEVLMAQIVVVDDDPLEEESTSDLVRASQPPSATPDGRATIAP